MIQTSISERYCREIQLCSVTWRGTQTSLFWTAPDLTHVKEWQEIRVPCVRSQTTPTN